MESAQARRPQAAHLAKEGFNVEVIPCDCHGEISPEAVAEKITDKTMMVAVLHASNEIGTIQPIAEIGNVTREKGIPFLVDACQTLGHLPIDVNELNADIVTWSAHKFYGPKGVGGIYIRKGTPVSKFLFGGDQEKGQRASTQNVPGIVGMAKALELSCQRMDQESATQKVFRDHIVNRILKVVPGARLNGDEQNRLPNNIHFSFKDVDSQPLLIQLDMKGIAASMGSACTAGSMNVSEVVQAIGVPEEYANGSLRLTLGRWTSEEDVEYLLETLPRVVEELRK